MLGIHDAQFVETRWSEDQRDLIITLRGGWVGYFDLTITYRGAALSAVEEWGLARIVRSRICDVLSHEWHQQPNGSLEHYVLCHPGHWFTIRCAEMTWTRVELPGERRPPLPERGDRFPGGPPTPLFIEHGSLYPTRGSRLSWRVAYFQDRRDREPHRRSDREYLAMRRADLRKKLAAEQHGSAS